MLKHVWCIGHSQDVGEVDPGENAEKTKGKVAPCFGQDHRHYREGRILRLTDKGEFSLVLLGVAKAVRTDQDDRRLGCPDGLFQCPDPG
jgi:hypothetical protein